MLRSSRALIVSLAALTASAQAQTAKPTLIGTWRLVDFCNVDTPGDTTYTLGRQPVGYFIYDPKGNLSIQAMRTPTSGAFAKDSVPFSGMLELRSSYFGYFGTYTITSDTTVVHHVKGGTIPSYIGTDQPRDYRIRGDTLTIGVGKLPSCRRLIRVRSPRETDAPAAARNGTDYAVLVQAAEHFVKLFDNLE